MATKQLRTRSRTRSRTARRIAGTRRILDGVFHLDRLLRNGACRSLADLAEILEASERTVQRYIEVLRDRFSVEVVYDRERGGYCYAEDGLAIPASRLSDDELIALYVSAPILAQYRGTPLEEDFTRALTRLTSALPASVRDRLLPVPDRVTVKATVPKRKDVDRFRTIFRATLNDRRLRLTYWAAYRRATSVRVVDPYALHCVHGQWYLIAYCHQRKEVTPFHTSRIWSAGETGETFKRPANFRVDAFLADAFGIFRPPAEGTGARNEDIVLRFDAFAARYVSETEWHPSQELKELDNGALQMRLRLGTFVEIERFVLGWGEHVEVLAPDALRRGIARRLASTLERYQRREPRDPTTTRSDVSRD